MFLQTYLRFSVEYEPEPDAHHLRMSASSDEEGLGSEGSPLISRQSIKQSLSMHKHVENLATPSSSSVDSLHLSLLSESPSRTMSINRAYSLPSTYSSSLHPFMQGGSHSPLLPRGETPNRDVPLGVTSTVITEVKEENVKPKPKRIKLFKKKASVAGLDKSVNVTTSPKRRFW